MILESSHRNKFRGNSPPRYWSMPKYKHGDWVVESFGGAEYAHARNIAWVAGTAYEVARSTWPLFDLERNEQGYSEAVKVTTFGGPLIGVLRLPLDAMAAAFPDCELNPMFWILRAARQRNIPDSACLFQWDGLAELKSADAALIHRQLEGVVSELRARWAAGEIAQALEPARRRLDTQARDAQLALKEAFDDCPRLLAVHLDLHFLQRELGDEISKAQAMACLAKFQRYLNNHYPLIRFIRCVEYGAESGFRFRFVVLLNAYLVADAAIQAHKMGEHWRTVITGGAGAYCCFNLPSRSGLGTISFTDKQRVEALRDQEVAQIVKPNFWIRYIGQRKTFQISQKPQRELAAPLTPVVGFVPPRSAVQSGFPH